MQMACHQYTRLATRFVMASLCLFFFELSDKVHECDSQTVSQAFLVGEKQWGELLSLGLIHPEEKSFLDGLDKDDRRLILLHWSGEVVRMGHKESGAPANALTPMLG